MTLQAIVQNAATCAHAVGKAGSKVRAPETRAPPPAHHRDARPCLFRRITPLWTADIPPANARQHPFSASRNRRNARPAATSSERPRPQPPRPRSSPAGAGGSSDRPGRHVPSRRLRQPEPRPAQTREPRRGGRRRHAFSGVAVRGERRAAAQVSAAYLAPHALDRDGGVRAHEVRQAAPPQGRRRRREQGPVGSRRGGRRRARRPAPCCASTRYARAACARR